MKYALLWIMVGMLAIATSYGSSSSINATVAVQCPFALQLNMKPVYTIASSQSANFIIYATANCTIPNMAGTFSIIASNSTKVYAQAVSSGNVSMAHSLHQITFNTNALVNGSYSASLNFSYFGFANHSFTHFEFVNPSNIVIESFSTTGIISQGAQQAFYLTLNNTGDLASTNDISVSINISGPSKAFIKVPSNYSLSPRQLLNLSISAYNTTPLPGTYSAQLIVTYLQSSTNTINTRYRNLSYTVVPIVPPAPPPVKPKAVAPIPQFSIISFPFYISLMVNQSSSNLIDLKNPGSTVEYIDISVPSAYSKLISLSAKSITLAPNQTIGISALMTAYKSIPPGTYVIPISINATISDKTAAQTIYTTLSISNTTEISAMPSISLLNNTNDAAGYVEISNPTGRNLTNMVIKTILPAGITTNVSSITTYGIPSSIARVNGSYIITWYVSALLMHSSTYAYFTIYNITAQTLLTRISTIFSAPSVPPPSSIIKIIDINVPTFYMGSISTIKVSAFYAGTISQRISTYISAPPGTVIYNATQYINATPNMAFTESFPTYINATGTSMLNLYMSTPGANLSYSVPVFVLAKPTITTTFTTTIVPSPTPLLTRARILEYGALSASILIIAIVILAVSKMHKRPRYSKERAEKLRIIREEIKRSE